MAGSAAVHPVGDDMDPRRAFVVSTIIDSLAVPAPQRARLYTALANDDKIGSFLEEPSVQTVAASAWKETNGQLRVVTSASVDFPTGCDYQVVFSKEKPGVVSVDDIPGGIVVATRSSPQLSSLHHLLKTVYAPLLKSGACDKHLQDLLVELESGIGTLLRRNGVTGISSRASTKRTSETGPPSPDFIAILTPSDEFQVWQELAADEQLEPGLKAAAARISQEFETLRRGFSSLSTLSEDALLELVESARPVLDAVWQLGGSAAATASPNPETPLYPQRRMAHLLALLSDAVAAAVVERVRPLDTWQGAVGEVERVMTWALRLIATWERDTLELTKLAWPSRGGNVWAGEPFYHKGLAALRVRIDEILKIREVHEELILLLSSDEAHFLTAARCFEPFRTVQVLDCSAYNEARWKAAVSEHHARIAPIETRIAEKLRETFGVTLVPALTAAVSGQGAEDGNGLAQPSQVFQQLRRYGELLARPIISEALSNEKQSISALLFRYLGLLRNEFDDHSAGHDSSDALSSISWAVQMEAKVDELMNTFALFSGVDAGRSAGGSTDASEKLSDLRRDVIEYKKAQFKQWDADTRDKLPDMALEASGRLMDLDAKDGHVEVHFTDDLVKLVQEVRALSSLGFQIKADVSKAAETARRFSRHGVVLQQVANFYNEIGTQMVPSQKGMMLDDALRFEQVLKNPRDGLGNPITWNNAPALQDYITRLQEVAMNLTEKNRKLRKKHTQLGEKVGALTAVDLVRQRDRWKEGVRDLRAVFDGLEKQGVAVTRDWRAHWDHQLYKALQYQYRKGLQSLNENLPPTTVKLVFKQKKLQFEPGFEEIRQAHFREIQKFLNIPQQFKGVGDSTIFRHMMKDESLVLALANVYERAEVLLQKLAEEQKKLSEWVALGTVDLEEFVDAHLDDVPDWELNFRILKMKAKESDAIPAEIKVDCYTIVTIPTKIAVEEQMKRLHEALCNSLRRKAVADKDGLEKFIADGRKVLEGQPQSVEDIGRARQEAFNLVSAVPAALETRRKCEEKLRLLRQVSPPRAATVDLSSLLSQWDDFTARLSQHEAHLAEQKEKLKTKIEADISEFCGRLEAFATRWAEIKPSGIPAGGAESVIQKIEDALRFVKEFEAEAAAFASACGAFEMETPEGFRVLEVLKGEVFAAQEAWGRYGTFSAERKELSGKAWTTVRGKLHLVEEFLLKWAEAVKGSVKNDPVSVLILQETERYRKCLPFLRFVREDIKWAEISALLGMTENGRAEVKFDDLTLGHFLARADAMVSRGDELKALHAQAQGEVVLRDSLNVLKVWGLERRFTLIKYESGKPCALIKEWKDVMTEVGDHQSLVQSLKESPFFAPFKDETSTWERRLGALTEGLQQLNGIQRKWVYLEPIFARGALPQEQARFRRVDEEFRQLMGGIAADTLVTSFADVPRLRDNLPRLSAQLDICQKALSDFLEEKRSHFPRFYFIGDDDMLEILGQAKNPTVIQAHLKKLFAGIHSVEFGVNNQSIVAMKSVDGEVVSLVNPVVISDRVEDWLSDLATGMKLTLKDMLARCLETKDYNKFPMQILCLADQIDFTQRCEAALQRGGSQTAAALKELVAEQKQQLKEYTSVDMEGQHVLQLKIKALILDLIHNVDVLEQLIDAKAASPDDWAWQRQLRFYRSQNSDAKVNRSETPGGAVVRMAESEFEYSFEYQGNAPKLVYTPLSDKCYLTLTQGMHLGYGGNPYGPAGTGKTESVKALGQFLGRQVLVFNCDEQFDFRSMGRIFTGLVKCGAWGCFDEFNRLEEDVLSAVSQQIQTIQAALKEGAKTVEFLGQSISVDRNAGIFVTLNPAGKGYGGRSKLPDNLKALFRSVAMTVPDNELIAEVNLISEGFQDAKTLGRKLVALFSLGRQLLSRQQHYDWGLRALKTVLGTAGQLLHHAKGKGDEIPPAQEAKLIVRSLRVTTLPKLAFADTRRFVDLVADVFPGVSVSDVSDAELEAAIAATCREMKLEAVRAQVEKVLQLHVACKQRIGVIVVGPSGTGKTTLWRILEGALRLVNGTAGTPPVKLHVMNPKAIPRQQLLGHMDMDTREWFDGVLTSAARQVVREPAEQHSWIVCDGDVDPEWIESLNSVLDDNHLLTLPSGERIQFGPNVNFIFECQDLKFASPATVSRTGMIFLSGDNLDAGLIVRPWLAGLPDDVRDEVTRLVDDYLHPALQWVFTRRAAVETTQVGTIHTALSHLTAESLTGRHEFLRGLARGLGANLEPQSRAQLLEQLANLSGESVSSIASAPDRALLDTGESLITGVRVTLTEHIRQGAATLIPWLEAGQPVLLSGPEGAGKTTLLDFCLAQLKSTAVSTIHCSAQTNASHVVQKLVQMCGNPVTTAAGRVLRPRESERLILVLKDLNLPKPDKYDTTQLVQFLQQLITAKGFYNEALEFIGLERIQIVATMNPLSSAGRHPLSSRFTSIVRVASLEAPPRAQLEAVYSAMLADIIRDVAPGHPTWGSESTVRKLAASMLEVYQSVQEAFSVEREKHYLFTPRRVTEWVQSLRRYDLRSEDVPSVLLHEATRIFSDRLVGPEPRADFERILAGTFKATWRGGAEKAESVYSVWGGAGDARQSARVGSALSRMPAGDYHKLVQDKLAAFEREFQTLNIFLFPETLERIAAMERILTRPGGSLLLLGRSGVGRRSCTRLVAYMHHMDLVSPSLSRSYDLKAFKAELKTLLAAAGVEGKKTCLLLEDQHLAQPAFLEVVNSVLSGGEVPGLYTNEELQSLLLPLQELMASDGFQHKSAFSFFVARVRQNLHVVLSMDPSNPDFDARCASNPALFASCAVMWLDTWTHERMRDVSKAILSAELSAATQEADGIDGQIVSLMAAIHTSLDSEGAAATPRQYAGFLEAYQKLFGAKRAEVLEQKGHLQAGLDKLAEAAGKVGELSQQAAEQQVLLTQKQTEAEAALIQITDSMARAGDSKAEIERLRVKLAGEEQILNGRKAGIQSELSEIQPLIDAAKKAVGQIKNDNLNEIRSLKMPPDAIRDVLEGVLLLMGNYDTSWTNMKKFLGSKSVKDEIVNYDARKVTPDMRAAVQKLLQAKGASFEHERIYRVSVAAAPMAAWVKANVQFSVVLEKVKPLEDDLASLQASLDASTARVKQCEDDLASLDGTVARLKEEFARRTGEAEALKIGLQQAKDKLAAAESLTEKLGGEKVRWEAQIGGLAGRLQELPLEALLAAAFMTYLPGQPEDFRRRMLATWQDLAGAANSPSDGPALVPDSKAFDFKRYMSTESEMLTWKAEGLPSDDLSVENAVVLLHTQQVPLVIDPSAQAAEWLRKHLREKVASMEVVAQQDPRFTTTLELAVRFGKTLLVTEVDAIEPMLYPLLRRDVSHSNSRLTVQIGDKNVDYNKDFRLFLVTRDPGLSIPPDAVSLILRTNFTVTRSGLEGQLLGLTIQSEQPELENKRSTLLKTGEEMRVQLASLEKQLLEELATSQGNILDNRALVASLNETKAKSTTVAASLLESQALQRSLDARRETYRPLAVSGSRLYFLLKSLPGLNRMYHFSLSAFLRLFKSVLSRKSAEPGTEETDGTDLVVDGRIAELMDGLIQTVFGHVTRSLFKADRLTFGLHLAQALRPCAAAELQLFTGQSVLPPGVLGAEPLSWVSDSCRASFNAFQATLPPIAQNLDFQNKSKWSAWMSNASAETDFPPHALPITTPFQRLLLIQALRPDRLESGMELYVRSVLGLASTSPEPFSLGKLHQETTAKEPVIFITSPGADPSQELEEFAARAVGPARFRQLAMGQGQSEIALAMLKEAARAGDWVCFKNLHLVVTWLPALEKEIHGLDAHPDFRLWLTSEPHDRFPPSLLMASLKVTYEAPPGLKKNLLRTYEAWTSDFVADGGSTVRAQLLFLLAWFHAIVQERRTFVPQGWSKFYEFSFADLRSGADIVSIAVNQAPPKGPIPWEFLRGLLENAIYGGRIDNRFDVQVLRAYLHQFFHEGMLAGPGQRFVPGTKGVLVPGSLKHGEFVEVLGGLPDGDAPALFGLPANIERNVQQTNSANVVAQLKMLSFASPETATGEFDRGRWSEQLRPVIELWDRLLGELGGLDRVCRVEQEPEDATPTESAIFRESQLAASLVRAISNILGGIHRALSGQGLLSPDALTSCKALLGSTVPSSWDRLWEGPEEPSAYLQALFSRVAAQPALRAAAKSGSLPSRGSSLDLSHLFSPETFLNALRQQTARRRNMAMDEMKLATAWNSELLGDAAADALQVTSLLIQGASFDGKKLADVAHDAPFAQTMPTVYMAWIAKGSPYPYKEHLAIPLYNDLGRTRFLSELQLPLAKASERDRWILTGLAAFVQG